MEARYDDREGGEVVPKQESEQRLGRLRQKLAVSGIDGALFVYPIDVYYFTGTRQNAALWVPQTGNPTLFVRKSLSRAQEESLVPDVRPFPPSAEFASFFGTSVRQVGMTFDVLPVQQLHFYEKILKGIRFSDISAVNRELRSVKSPWELDQMRESGGRLCEVFREVPSFLKIGVRERDLAGEIEYRLRTQWSEGYLRMRAFNQEITGLAVAGESAAVPGCFDGPVTGKGLSSSAPYGPSGGHIKENVPVLIDYPGVFNGYIVDMTRIFVMGDLDSDLKKAFEVSLEIQDWLLRTIRPGVICEDLFAGAAAIAESAGLADKFMGYAGEQAKFVGHGVGLELDEFPILAQKFKSPLREGQTIAIEPKFVFPGRGVVGIENTIAVTSSGCENLTDFPDEIVYV
ncbi:MAG: Xaa-Pro peptidase family protein [Nitrospiraceae bacterium]|nr:Xaa-Pro peptidase family protein [Nitrospiraceae bacterium]